MNLFLSSKPPTAAQRERWQKWGSRGKKSFILRIGVLGWGGFMFAVMTAQELIRSSHLPRSLMDYGFDIAINLLIWPIAGYCFGLAMWHTNQKRFTGSNLNDAAVKRTRNIPITQNPAAADFEC
jgi:hypothetical protein